MPDPFEEAFAAVEQEEAGQAPAAPPAPAAPLPQYVTAGVPQVQGGGNAPVPMAPAAAPSAAPKAPKRPKGPDPFDDVYRQVASQEIGSSSDARAAVGFAREMGEALRDREHLALAEQTGQADPQAIGQAVKRASDTRRKMVDYFRNNMSQRLEAIPDVEIEVPDSRLAQSQNAKLYGQPFRVNPREVAKQTIREGYLDTLSRDARRLILSGQFSDTKDPAVPDRFAFYVKSHTRPEDAEVAGQMGEVGIPQLIWQQMSKQAEKERPVYELAKKYISGEQTDIDPILDMKPEERTRFLGYVYEAANPTEHRDLTDKAAVSMERGALKIWMGLQGFAAENFGTPPEVTAEKDRLAGELRTRGYNLPDGTYVTANMPADLKKLIGDYHKAAGEAKKFEQRGMDYEALRRQIQHIQESKDPLVGDNWFEQGIIDTAASMPYMAAYMAASAAGPLGVTTAKLVLGAAQAVDFQDKLREMGGEITPEVRGISLAAGVLYQQIEQMQAEGLLLAPKVGKQLGETLSKRILAYVADRIKRHGVNYLEENAEEVLQQGVEWGVMLMEQYRNPNAKVDWEKEKAAFGKSIRPMLVSMGLMVGPGAAVDVARDMGPSLAVETEQTQRVEPTPEERVVQMRALTAAGMTPKAAEAVLEAEAVHPVATPADRVKVQQFDTLRASGISEAEALQKVNATKDEFEDIRAAVKAGEAEAATAAEKPAEKAPEAAPSLGESEAAALAEAASKSEAPAARADLEAMKTPELGKMAKELGVSVTNLPLVEGSRRKALIARITAAQAEAAPTIELPAAQAGVTIEMPKVSVPAEAGPRTQTVEQPKTPPAPETLAPSTPLKGVSEAETVEYRAGPHGEKSPPRRKTIWTAKQTAQMSHEERGAALLTDRLTGLGSKRAWLEAKPRAFSALVNLDIKQQNDTPRQGVKSHVYGDHAALEVARRLHAVFGQDAYRLGGGNFRIGADTEAGLAEKLEAVKGSLPKVAGVAVKMGYTIGPDTEHRPAVKIRSADMSDERRQWFLTHDEQTELQNDVAFEENPELGHIYRVGGDEFAVLAGDGVVALDINGLGTASKLFGWATGDLVLVGAVEAMEAVNWNQSAAQGLADLTKALDGAIVKWLATSGDVYTLGVEVAGGYGRTYELADAAAGDAKRARSGLVLRHEVGERGRDERVRRRVAEGQQIARDVREGRYAARVAGAATVPFKAALQAGADAGLAPAAAVEPAQPAAPPSAETVTPPPAPAVEVVPARLPDVQAWASKLQDDKRKVVVVTPAAEMGEHRATWDPLTGEIRVADNLTEAESRAVEQQADGLQRLRMVEQNVSMTTENGRTVQVPATKTARELGRRLANLRAVLDCLRRAMR